MCEVLIQSACKSQRTSSHPPHPTPPRKTRDVSKRLQVSECLRRKWALCQSSTPGLTFLLWIAARNSLVSACESGEQWGRALYFLSCAEMEAGWTMHFGKIHKKIKSVQQGRKQQRFCFPMVGTNAWCFNAGKLSPEISRAWHHNGCAPRWVPPPTAGAKVWSLASTRWSAPVHFGKGYAPPGIEIRKSTNFAEVDPQVLATAILLLGSEFWPEAAKQRWGDWDNDCPRHIPIGLLGFKPRISQALELWNKEVLITANGVW